MKNRVFLEIQKLTENGEGIGHAEDREIHVPFALPGEHVDAQIESHSKHKLVSFARLLSIQKASPERRDPSCPHVARCGGCNLPHITYAAQLQHKTEFVRSTLSLHKNLDKTEIKSCIASPRIEGYRSTAKWVVARHRGRVVLGSYARRSHEVVSMEGCLVHRPALEALREQLCHIFEQFHDIELSRTGLRYLIARESTTSHEQGLVLVHGGLLAREEELVRAIQASCRLQSIVAHENTSSGDNLFDRQGNDRLLAGTWGLTEQIGNSRVTLPLRSFLQINREQAGQLYDYIEGLIRSERHDVLVDLYGGAGELSLRLASSTKQVWLVERASSAIDAAKQAIVQEGRQNIICLEEDAYEAMAKIAAVDLVCMNPPRSGMSADTISALLRAGPSRMIYTSCSPQNFARDAAKLCEGGYRLVSVQPFDLFPQTSHVEIVALFHKVIACNTSIGAHLA